MNRKKEKVQMQEMSAVQIHLGSSVYSYVRKHFRCPAEDTLFFIVGMESNMSV